VAASERKELNSSRNLEKNTQRLTDGGGRYMLKIDNFVCDSLRITLDDSNGEMSGTDAGS